MQTLLIVLTLSHLRALHDALRETFLKVTNNENDTETSFRRALVLDRELWIGTKKKRTLLVAWSLACLEMNFVVKGAGAVILLFRLEYKTSAICYNVNTQKAKIARRDRPHILAYILVLLLWGALPRAL